MIATILLLILVVLVFWFGNTLSRQRAEDERKRAQARADMERMERAQRYEDERDRRSAQRDAEMAERRARLPAEMEAAHIAWKENRGIYGPAKPLDESVETSVQGGKQKVSEEEGKHPWRESNQNGGSQ